MSKRDRHNQKRREAAKRRRATRHRHQDIVVQLPRDDEPDLLRQIRQALAGPPLSLLELASALLAATDPRSRDPYQGRAQVPPSEDIDFLLHSFIDVDRVETAALLCAIAHMAPDWASDDTLAAATDAWRRREQDLPDWLTGMSKATITGVFTLRQLLGEEESIGIGASLVDGTPLTANVRLAHRGSSAVVDGFVLGAELADVQTRYVELSDGEPTTWVDSLALDDARVRVEVAIQHGGMTWPEYTTDTWPLARPLVEWLTSLLPAGDQMAEDWEDLGEEVRTAIVQAVMDSHGRDLDNSDDPDILDTLLWMTHGYGSGDALLIGRVLVDDIMLDLVPRKIAADAEYLLRIPAVLRTLIRYGHQQRDIPAKVTGEVLAHVDALEPEYRSTALQPRVQGPAALLQRMGVGPSGEDDWATTDHQWLIDARQRAADRVGGMDALLLLDATPLPDEPLVLTDVADDQRQHLMAVAELADGWAAEVRQPELRTAVRRLLQRWAAAGGEGFGGPERDAAAVLWLLGRANGLVGTKPHQWTITAMRAHLDAQIGPLAKWGRSLAESVGATRSPWGDSFSFGDADVLVSSARQAIIDLRDGPWAGLDD